MSTASRLLLYGQHGRNGQRRKSMAPFPGHPPFAYRAICISESWVEKVGDLPANVQAILAAGGLGSWCRADIA